MTHLLSKVKEADDFDSVFKAFDTIRRPRAQKVVETSIEAGKLYSLTHPDIGTDMEKLVKFGRARLPWIWFHDLDEDARLADIEYEKAQTARRTIDVSS